jgi:hypothetical protein
VTAFVIMEPNSDAEAGFVMNTELEVIAKMDVNDLREQRDSDKNGFSPSSSLRSCFDCLLINN